MVALSQRWGDAHQRV